jgi:RNA polymerase-interacting CarD/CdnL/TRCF family regulator
VAAASFPDTPDARIITLTDGGELTLAPTEHGRYRLTIDADGMHLSVPLSRVDVMALREATGEIVLAHLREVEAA